MSAAAWRRGPACVAVALALLVVAHGARGARGADFWEHAAVVRELAARPLAPTHPLLALDAPHAFASPYALAVGLVARVTGPERALDVAGVCNVALLVWALGRLVRAVSDDPRAPLLALLAALLLWGWAPWRWSGFLHLDALTLCAGYPSTFAAGAALLGLGAAARSGAGGRPGELVALLACAALVVLCHPLTAAFLACGVVALALGRGERRRGAAAVAALGAGLALACAWPLFPLVDLALREGAAFHADNAALWVGWRTVTRLGPALLGVGALALEARGRPWLAAWTLALLAAWCVAGATGAWSYGRVLAQVALLLQVALALALAARWDALPPRGRRGVALAALALLAAGAAPVALRLARGPAPLLEDARALSARVGERDVVLAAPRLGGVLVARAGRLVASDRPLAFVPDHDARRADLARALDPGCPDAERAALLRARDVRLVLVDAREASAWLRAGLALEASAGALVLLRVPAHS